MSRPVFQGAGVAIVTPFTDNGIDFAKLEQMIDSGDYMFGLKTDGNWSRAIIFIPIAVIISPVYFVPQIQSCPMF